MNEEDLRLMVVRARDAEGSPPSPPPGLVDEARTAARRRRRVVTAAAGCAVAAVIVAGVAVPQLLSGDQDPGPDQPVAGTDTGELEAHGGPCPLVLPAPVDDGGHGFGTSSPAPDHPSFTTPDSAWVCQYGTRRLGTTDAGTQWEWTLNHTPRRLDDARLGPVDASLQSIANTGYPQACTDDLGPRWLLVTSTDGDLTGVVADGYGCGYVRLTDDPFVTAPGDPQDGGTVPGVLTAPGLAAMLEEWWDTSPADVESSPTPAELRVTCTDDGPQVETTTVAAQPAGVVVVVTSTMTTEGSYLTYTSDGPSGGDRLDQIPDGTTYAFPPGELTLGCASPPDMDETATVSVEVTDPYGYWRTSTLAAFGCPPGGAQPSWAVGDGTGPTPRVAVDRLLAKLAATISSERSDFTAEPAPTGYSGAATQTWVAANRGQPAFSVVVTGAEGSFTANPDVLCGRP